MNTRFEKLYEMRNKANSYWGDRITAQMLYLGKLLQYNENEEVARILNEGIDTLYVSFVKDGTLNDAACKSVEKDMCHASVFAKTWKVICAAHAHIDMNWMWAYDETVAVTLDTFRTMLDFMNEYSDFTFSQSQASVYKIVEEFDPDMLEEIKKRVHEGRWELTATTWVETDKNMTNGESLVRHILYTKKYLSKLFGIDGKKLKIDFEPDTFGHNINVPEIMNKGGIEYYYHCRGDANGIYLQNWESPSGKKVLVHIEPDWYNSELNSNMVMYMPEFWNRTGVDTLLRVYGVGNHGGGATRRDIEKCIDMASWPIFPSIKFGTMHEYFDIVKNHRNLFPVIKCEKNAIFTGCYTSQSRIKMANRVSEDRLYDSETLSSMAAVFEGAKYDLKGFESAWCKTLFNHFHDILPGSGVIDTREYAMGQFQQTMAIANTEQSKAMRAIADKINTANLISENCDLLSSNSEGAGVGYGLSIYNPPQTERGKGINRVVHIFNSLPFEREELCEIVIWDWPGDLSGLKVADSDQKDIPFQIIDFGRTRRNSSTFWGHSYVKILLLVKVPPTGYTTVTVSQRSVEKLPEVLRLYDRTHVYSEYKLDNEKISVTFDSNDMSVISLIDKATGEELINEPSCMLRYILEDTSRGMTSWIVGRYKEIKDFRGCVKNVRVENGSGLLRKNISYDVEIMNSKLKVFIGLDSLSDSLNYIVDCEWLEVGKPDKGIPQLNFTVPFSYKCEDYKYGIAFGSIDRKENTDDRPGIGYVTATRNTGSKIAVHAKTKYGFVCVNDSISIDLIRSSYDPDPHPELCNHHMEFSVQVLSENVSVPEKESLIYRHPLSFISGKIQKGELAPKGSYLALDASNVYISAVKLSQDQTGMILRLYNVSGNEEKATVILNSNIKQAFNVDLDEDKVDGVVEYTDNKLYITLGAYSVESIKVIL